MIEGIKAGKHSMSKSRLRLSTEEEVKAIKTMVTIYCKGQKHEQHGSELCEECQSLLDYANARIDRCPRKEVKTFCNTCPIHCYKPEYRNKIKEVMKYSGPRLLYKHPVIATRHVLNTIHHKVSKKSEPKK